MALVVADRVRETTSSTGTGTITLGGSYSGFQAFSVIGNGNSTYYAISDPNTGAWEVGIGTYTLSTNALSRDTVLSSSNSGSLVSFAAGNKDVICTQPSERAVFSDGTNIVSPGGGTIPNTLLANSSVTVNGNSVSLGGSTTVTANTTNTLTRGSYLTGSNFNGSAATTWAVDATSANTASKVVARDASGNFSAGTITASLSGNATTATSATSATTATTATNADNVYLTASATASAFKVPFANTTVSTSGNYGLLQDSAAEFTYNPSTNTLTVGTVSGALSGNATTATTLQTARTINGVSFNGSANITVTANTTNTLTLGSYLTGTSFNGSAAVTAAVDATSANTASKVVARDASGNFSAGTITAALSGNATTATTLQTARTIAVSGAVTGTATSFNGSANITIPTTVSTTQGGIVYGASTTAYGTTAAGTAGQMLLSNGTSAPSWVTPSMTLIPDAIYKASVSAATTANITLSGTQTIDGVAVVAGMRVLVKDQTTASQNGIYVAAAGAWTRATDADASAELGAAIVGVDAGTANGGELWTTTFKTTDTLGTTAMNWYEVVYNSGTWAISVSGSAATLTTARTINGTSFNGSANITTANWGTARTITIGATGKSVNGSANVSWTTTEIGAVAQTGTTASAQLPAGTTAQRDASPSAGYIRFNSSITKFEGYNGTGWTSVGGGATGGGSDSIFFENGQTVTTSYTITSGNNAGTFGPITVASGVTVTVPSGSVWTVV